MRVGVRLKLLIFAALAWSIIFGLYGAYMYYERTSQMERMAVNSASLLAREFIAVRSLLTTNLGAGPGASQGRGDFKQGPLASGVPPSAPDGHSTGEGFVSDPSIPSKFLRELSDSIGVKEGFSINLISLTPINKDKGPNDDFQHKGLKALATGDEIEYYTFEDVDGSYSLRYLLSDIAINEACVSCHNSHGGSARRDYEVGSVMGGVEVIIPVRGELSAVAGGTWRSLLYGLLVVAVFGLLGFAFVSRTVVTPILNIAKTTGRVASGDLTKHVSVETSDEIGDLGESMDRVVDNLHGTIEDLSATSGKTLEILGSVLHLSSSMVKGSDDQASSLDSIRDSMEDINSSISEISGSTTILAAATEKGSLSLSEIGGRTEDIAANMSSLFGSVNEMASSTEDISASIKDLLDSMEILSGGVSNVSGSVGEISRKVLEMENNASEADSFAGEVIDGSIEALASFDRSEGGIARIEGFVNEATGVVEDLRKRVLEVGSIFEVIKEVAGETNMLAMNAAIIASKASGEYGRSFAVISNEITELAERTEASTKEISSIIGAVDSESSKAVKTMVLGKASVSEGVALSKEAGEALKSIVERAKRSKESVNEVVTSAREQGDELKAIAEAAERSDLMSRHTVGLVRELSRTGKLVNRESRSLAHIASSVEGSTNIQVEANKSIKGTIGEVNQIVAQINRSIKQQSRNSEKILEAIEAVRSVAVGNISKARETDRLIEELNTLHGELKERVAKFKVT